jgi:hypothetical protein
VDRELVVEVPAAEVGDPARDVKTSIARSSTCGSAVFQAAIAGASRTMVPTKPRSSDGLTATSWCEALFRPLPAAASSGATYCPSIQ